ncbi:MAG TPA: peptidylprolyl isomerase [Kofleriaceae bacterium]
MRRSGASIFVYLIFGLLIIIFVINFAPNTGRSSGSGCGITSNTAMTIDGEKASKNSFLIAFNANQANGTQKRYLALDILLRRELLAQAAEAHGIKVDGDMVLEEIKKGTFFFGGLRENLGPRLFDQMDNGTKIWNYKKYKGWVSGLNVTPGQYQEDQIRGMEAALMSEMLEGSARVSREEARTSWETEHDTATYEVVAFQPGAYRATMRLTDADIARFLTTHAAEVDARYKADAVTYKGVKPQVRIREIFLPKAKKDEGAAMGSGSAAGSAAPTPPTPPAPTADLDKVKLEAARVAIAAGKQTFAAACKDLCPDDADKISGGQLGWRSVDSPQLGDKAVNDAIKTLAPGAMTPVITTDNGNYLVMIEAKRDGDLTFDQVKTEIAESLARDVWSKEAAKRAAIAALAEAKSSGKALVQLFDRAAPEPGGMQNLTPEQLEQLKQMMQQQQGAGGDDSGAIIYDLPYQHVAWYADKDGSGSAAAPAAAPAAPAAAAAHAAPAAAAPAAAPAAPAPVAAGAAPLAASTDTLPAFGDVPKPKVESEGPVPRRNKLPGLGAAKDAAAAVFDQLANGALAPTVFEADGNYVLVQLDERKKPELAEFDKVADQEIAELREARGRMIVREYLLQRCDELNKANRIKPAADLLSDTDDSGKPVPSTYRPCMYFSQF